MNAHYDFMSLKVEIISRVTFSILNNRMTLNHTWKFLGWKTVRTSGDDGAWGLKLKIPIFSLQKTVSFFRSERFVSIANHPVYWPAATQLMLDFMHRACRRCGAVLRRSCSLPASRYITPVPPKISFVPIVRGLFIIGAALTIHHVLPRKFQISALSLFIPPFCFSPRVFAHIFRL